MWQTGKHMPEGQPSLSSADHCPAEMWAMPATPSNCSEKPEIQYYVNVPSVLKHCEDSRDVWGAREWEGALSMSEAEA